MAEAFCLSLYFLEFYFKVLALYFSKYDAIVFF